MLDFRMDTFLTVCKYMNFTKAAKALHITQPAVSQHIGWIERQYQIRLFEFQGKKMYLTEDGRQLFHMATTLKHDEQALRRSFQENHTGKKQLIFGVTLTIGEYVIGEYLARYTKHNPDSQIKLSIANTEVLLQKLNEGELDFAVVEGFFEKSEYDFQLFRKERYVGVCAADSPLFREESHKYYRWEQLFGETLISREKGSGTREMLERTLAEEGYKITDFSKVIEIENMNAIKTMTICGGGISFLYEAAVKKELEAGILKEILVEGFPKYHDFTFIWRKDSVFTPKYQELFEEMTV